MNRTQYDERRLRALANTLNQGIVTLVISIGNSAPDDKALSAALLEATLNVEIDVSDVRCKRLASSHDRALLHIRNSLDDLSCHLYAAFQRRLMPAVDYAQLKLIIVQMKFLIPEYSSAEEQPMMPLTADYQPRYRVQAR